MIRSIFITQVKNRTQKIEGETRLIQELSVALLIFFISKKNRRKKRKTCKLLHVTDRRWHVTDTVDKKRRTAAVISS